MKLCQSQAEVDVEAAEDGADRWSYEPGEGREK